MTELLLNRASSAARTSSLVITDSQHQSKGEVVVHPDVVNDLFHFTDIFEVNPAETDVRRLIGSHVLAFKGRSTGEVLYVYGQSDVFKAASQSVGVPVSLFQQLAQMAQHSTDVLSIRVHPVLFRVGGRAVENRPMYQIAHDLGSYRVPSPGTLRASPVARHSAGVAQSVTHTVTQPVPQRNQGSTAPRVNPAARRSQPAPAYRSYGRYVYDERDTVGDALFLEMYPGIAPLYRPGSILAWSLWFNSINYAPGQYFYDPCALNDWAFVPGFPGAVSQVVMPFGDGYRVELMDAVGVCVGNFSFSGYGEQMEFITGDGDVFSVVNAGQPYVQFVDDGQAFCWNGIDEPFMGAPVDVQAAILDAGPLYEPGPMFEYADPGMDAVYGQPVFVGDGFTEPGYVDPGYVDPGYIEPGLAAPVGAEVAYMDPNAGYADSSGAAVPSQGAFYDAPVGLPADTPADPSVGADIDDSSAVDYQADNNQVDNYQADDYQPVDTSPDSGVDYSGGNDFSGVDTSGGGDSWD